MKTTAVVDVERSRGGDRGSSRGGLGAMWGLAARNLAKERVRLGISIGGVAFAVLLMVLLRGLFVAYETKVGDYFRGLDADAWVLQEGTADFFHSFSILPDTEALTGVEGVEDVRPYVSRQVGFTLDGSETLIYLAGLEEPSGAPGGLVEGTLDLSRDGIAVDRVFAMQAGVGIGDVLTLNGTPLTIEGITSGGDMVMFQYGYVTLPTAREILEMPDQVNAFLLDVEPGADLEALASEIEAANPLADVVSTEEVVERNQRVINDGFLPVIAVLLVIGFLVGVAVIGLTIYSAVLEKRREYGVLKALGARGGQMTNVIVSQAVYSAGGGYVVGVGLAFVAGWAASRWVPEFITDIRLTDLGLVAAATVVMAIVASAIPLVRLARIDPAEVFRA